MSERKKKQKLNQIIRTASTYGKAHVIAASRKIIKIESTTPMWQVESETEDGKMYNVAYINEELQCSCMAYQTGLTVPCKHGLSIAVLSTAIKEKEAYT